MKPALTYLILITLTITALVLFLETATFNPGTDDTYDRIRRVEIRRTK